MPPKFKPMETPTTRAEFELRLNSLREKVMQGKMHVGPGAAGLGDHLAKLRLLPNGRIDMLSVDELTRLQANMMFTFDPADYPELAAGQDAPE